jgi:hypothetical protein
VPEILMVNRSTRLDIYRNEHEAPISWIKTDPKGYINQATNINAQNANFRHCVKLVKAWRNSMKVEYGDQFKLKSFHVEQAIAKSFLSYAGCTTIDAAIESVELILNTIGVPAIADRANPTRCIDGYTEDLDYNQKDLMRRSLLIGQSNLVRIANSRSESELIELADKLLSAGQKSSFQKNSTIVTPVKPWLSL